ncbi:Membrane-bound metallopeptidase [hydrothermal vent metagenome]|uniref:Membrane-bound metallopeptidase n=1 Tax=hydrothermal vent metagenome TaxID=652676 RepID=A0A1W1CEY9_9ZZZZ
MAKFFLLLLVLISTESIMASSTTEKKIKKSVVSLDKSIKKQKKMSSQLEMIAKNIDKTNRENRALNKKLQKLSAEFSKNENVYQMSKKELAKYNKSLAEINKKIKEKHDIFIKTLADQASIVYAMSQSHEATRKSIVLEEAYILLKKQNSKDLAILKQQIREKNAKKREIISKRKLVKKKINSIAKQRDEYKKEREAKHRLLKKLAMDEDRYQAKLKKIIDTQNALKSTLADLNIIQKKEVEEERRIAAAQKAAMLAEKRRKAAERKRRKEARAKARREGKKVVYNTKIESTPSNRSVKKIGSSYRKSKVYAYHGVKTISPLSNAKVVKRFGSYVDPIYKIHIFNTSITLKSRSSNAKVKNILNGKVVFAGRTSMLGQVVVVSHSGKMHTVYAGLSKIAPSISKGRRIKKGYVIGKVAHKLIFEATKNSKHINPMSLIRL